MLNFKTHTMKRIIYLIICSMMITISCDNGFEEVNIDPTAVTEIEVEYKFPKAILYASGQRYETWRGNFIYCSTMIQHLANTQGYWSGDKYFLNNDYAQAFWDAQYPQTIKLLEDIKADLEAKNKAETPEYAMTRILRVFAYHRITDLYGDVPYSEAGKLSIDKVIRPVYDDQEFIYNDMLKELNEAAILLNGGLSGFESADILFNGDLTKWKKWAYSLMLRLSMRLVKVDEGLAEQWAKTAIDGGVMTSNGDIAYIKHTQGNGIVQNANGEVFSADRSSRISTTFMDILQEDPRMKVLVALPNGNTDPSLQRGLPNGYDSERLKQEYLAEGGVEKEYFEADYYANFSEVNPAILQGEDAPMFFQTYAEVELMLAEAAFRWGLAGGDPESHYNAGVRAAISYLELYSPDAAISETEITDYLDENPYDASNALEQINTQYWIAVFLNEYEAYANWRRTGFPVLTPVNYPGNVTNGTIPRRLTYHTLELVTNKDNYDAAIANQGPDLLTTRVWWDKE